jgi:hypothetical protein
MLLFEANCERRRLPSWPRTVGMIVVRSVFDPHLA